MDNISLQIEKLVAGSTGVGANVIFGSVITSSGDISYDIDTGVVTINKAGIYLVNWFVATQTSLSSNGTVFALSSSQGDFIRGNSPIKTGEIYGTAVLDVTVVPYTLSLENASTATVTDSAVAPVKASLTIFEQTPQSAGPTGPTGPQGSTGATGPTGPTGPSATTAYGYVYHMGGTTTVVIAAGGLIPFSSNGPLNGVTHTLGSSNITVINAGVYKIDYYFTLTSYTAPSYIIATVNTIVDGSTELILKANVAAGSFLLNLAAGAVIAFKNNSANSITLVEGPPITAQISILKVN